MQLRVDFSAPGALDVRLGRPLHQPRRCLYELLFHRLRELSLAQSHPDREELPLHRTTGERLVTPAERLRWRMLRPDEEMLPSEQGFPSRERRLFAVDRQRVYEASHTLLLVPQLVGGVREREVLVEQVTTGQRAERGEEGQLEDGAVCRRREETQRESVSRAFGLHARKHFRLPSA